LRLFKHLRANAFSRPSSIRSNTSRTSHTSAYVDGSDDEDDVSGGVTKSGWLKKQGGGTSGTFARKNWKTRWFVLVGTVLNYYQKEKGHSVFAGARGGKPLGSLILDAKTMVNIVANKPKAFSIQNEKRQLNIVARNPKEAEVWAAVLNTIINRLIAGPFV
jgi:hypothetical protein